MADAVDHNVPSPPPLRVCVCVETFSGNKMCEVDWVFFQNHTWSTVGTLLHVVNQNIAATKPKVRMLFDAKGTHLTHEKMTRLQRESAQNPTTKQPWTFLASMYATEHQHFINSTSFKESIKQCLGRHQHYLTVDAVTADCAVCVCTLCDILFTMCLHCADFRSKDSVLRVLPTHSDPLFRSGRDQIQYKSPYGKFWHVALAIRSNAATDAVQLDYLHSLGCPAKSLKQVPTKWRVSNVTVTCNFAVIDSQLGPIHRATRVQDVMMRTLIIPTRFMYNSGTIGRCNRCMTTTTCSTVQEIHTYDRERYYSYGIETTIAHLQKLVQTPHETLRFRESV